jgi:hypothetical protein
MIFAGQPSHRRTRQSTANRASHYPIAPIRRQRFTLGIRNRFFSWDFLWRVQFVDRKKPLRRTQEPSKASDSPCM